jgi:DNA polymerase
MDRKSLKRQLEFYRDLGIRQLNIPEADQGAEPVSAQPPAAARGAAPPRTTAAEAARSKSAQATPVLQTLPSRLELAPADDTLERILADIGDCKRCRLCEKRNKIVFGSGNPQAKLAFVGEGPGADEDQQGLPFVGRAGQLLTQMINGTAMKEGLTIRREDVYICNVVKCRPPENRTPLPDETEICGQFLFRQLMVLRPKAICALGGSATKALLGTREGITKLRGTWQDWNGIRVMPTYHPSFLLRPYSQNAKREAWEDLKQVLHYAYD